jgi:hypothetical protein
MLVLADDKEANALLENFPHGEAKRGDGKPVKASYLVPLDVDPMAALA